MDGEPGVPNERTCVRGCGQPTTPCLGCRATFCTDCDRTPVCPWCAGRGLEPDGKRALALVPGRTTPQGVPFTTVCLADAEFEELCNQLANMPVEGGETGAAVRPEQIERIRRLGFIRMLGCSPELIDYFSPMGIRTKLISAMNRRMVPPKPYR